MVKTISGPSAATRGQARDWVLRALDDQQAAVKTRVSLSEV